MLKIRRKPVSSLMRLLGAQTLPKYLTMSRPKRKQRGGSACEFTQTLGGEILRQARELDELPPQAIFGVYLEGTRRVLPPGRGIRRVVRIFRERCTGGEQCYVVETRRAHVRFANVRHAVAAFALAVGHTIQDICTVEELGQRQYAAIRMFDPTGDIYAAYNQEVITLMTFDPLRLPPFSAASDAPARHARFVEQLAELLEAPPPRITLKPDSDLDADDQYFDLDQTWTNPADLNP